MLKGPEGPKEALATMGFGRGGPDLRGVIRIPSAPSNNAADSTLGPIGGPSIAQDVNTLVGQKAQPFSLSRRQRGRAAYNSGAGVYGSFSLSYGRY